MYWCETCGGINFHREDQLLSHLSFKHDIEIAKRGDYTIRTPSWLQTHNNPTNQYPTWVLTCKSCGQNLKIDIPLGIPDRQVYTLTGLAMHAHQKKHGKYTCGGKQFRSIISLLHYIDEKYHIHIGFVKGITHKRVFLDGISKEDKK